MTVPSGDRSVAGWGERVGRSLKGARGAVLLLSPNPMHDTGGGQRSAQIALELLERGYSVTFVAHGDVTETVDLGLRASYPRLVEASLAAWAGGLEPVALAALASAPRRIALTQVPIERWLPVLDRVRQDGGTTVFDLIDRWDSELGGRWYHRRSERGIVEASDVLVASAPGLVTHVETVGGRRAHLVPNAFNARVFHRDSPRVRPPDLPAEAPVVIYVGSLWGGWMDWALVRRVATELSDLLFVFIGDHRGEGRGLPSNCHFLGLKAQGELPAYLAHAAVGFLPWKVDAVTRATSPLKVYEQVAMGLPVVAPVLEPLDGIPGVELVEGGAAFAAALRRWSGARTSGALEAGMRAFAERNSWARRVDELLEVVGSNARAAGAVAAVPGTASETASGRAENGRPQRGRQRASIRRLRFQWSEFFRK